MQVEALPDQVCCRRPCCGSGPSPFEPVQQAPQQAPQLQEYFEKCGLLFMPGEGVAARMAAAACQPGGRAMRAAARGRPGLRSRRR